MDTKALRQKILDLAIRGKLVPQDPNDEPASVLLERIRAEKQQMVKDGKLKAKDIKNDTVIFKGDDNLHYEQFSDGTVKCIEDEIPFELPDSWAWCRLNSVVDVRDGTHDTPAYVKNGIPLITSKNLIEGGIDYSNVKYISEEDALIINERSGVNVGDILFAMIGTIGNPSMVTEDILISIKNVALFKFSFSNNLNNYYIMNYLDYAQENMKKSSSGGLQPFVSLNYLRTYLIPIPPVEEQARIVSVVNTAIEKIRSIDLLNDELMTSAESVKSKILDLAIRGKLVPQDPNDEPASVLLERIRAEKEELIKQGKIKRDKKESVIFKGDDNSYYEKIGDKITCIDDELPFEIPDNWCWARLSSFTEVIMGSSPRSQDICRDSNYTEFHQGKIYFSDCLLKESNQYTKNISKIAPKNSVLLCVRAPVGEVNITDREICIGRGLSSIHAYDKIQSDFLFYWLKTQKRVLVSKSTGSTFSAITVDTVKNILLPIPPITEQLKITQKILDFNSNIESIKASLR